MIQLTEQIIVNGILSGLVFVLMALGFTMIFGIMRVVNFAHGELYMMGAAGVLVLYSQWGIDYSLSVILAALFTGVVGVAIERSLFRPFVRSELNGMIMSLGVSICLQAIALIVLGPAQQAMARPISGVIRLGGAVVPLDRLAVGGIALGVIVLFQVFLKYTRTGLSMRAVAQDREVAALMGARVQSMAALAFGIAAGLAALAGGLMAPIYSVAPYMGELPMLKAFVVVVLGGLGSIPGAVVGGLIIGLVESVFATFFDSTLALIASFVIVLAIVLVRPRGLFGKLQA
ncbi:MAG: branched-chain amino acid ABC transporter permease [Rhodospirillum sp.]|nr:branched-chain amino acid ABC transporter permease [Rhodospirillum sp.]MCF8489713.1 branched-chain amino acid ABC transporter permease [Rhodospirillum sp.]MCF8502576.1 branched-chain amino acid ABC transporter permease [Rhodospirillum sp.]